jgi:hypothetical protein
LGYVYYEDSQTCELAEVSSYLGICPSGSYQLSGSEDCGLCMSNNDDNLCDVCSGNSFADCKKC